MEIQRVGPRKTTRIPVTGEGSDCYQIAGTLVFGVETAEGYYKVSLSAHEVISGIQTVEAMLAAERLGGGPEGLKKLFDACDVIRLALTGVPKSHVDVTAQEGPALDNAAGEPRNENG